MCKVELLALVKIYNKSNQDKIQNADKLKKDQLFQLCRRYNIIDEQPNGKENDSCLSLKHVSKSNLMKDIELHFLIKGSVIPPEIVKMKRKQIIEYMEYNDILHYTQSRIEEETKRICLNELHKNIIYYNIIRYDDVDVHKIDNDDLESFINEYNLDTNIANFKQYSILLQSIYMAYQTFCKTTGKEYTEDKLKSFVKILNRLDDITKK